MHEIGSSKSKLEHIRIRQRDYAEMMRQTKEETKERKRITVHRLVNLARVEGLKHHSAEMARKNRHYLAVRVIVLFFDATQLGIWGHPSCDAWNDKHCCCFVPSSPFQSSRRPAAAGEEEEKKRIRRRSSTEAAAARQLLPIYRSTEGSSSPYSSPPADSFFSFPRKHSHKSRRWTTTKWQLSSRHEWLLVCWLDNKNPLSEGWEEGERWVCECMYVYGVWREAQPTLTTYTQDTHAYRRIEVSEVKAFQSKIPNRTGSKAKTFQEESGGW